MDEYARFMGRLKETPEPGADGNMLDNTLLLLVPRRARFICPETIPSFFPVAENLGFRHGRYLKPCGLNFQGGAWDGGQNPGRERREP